MKLAAQVRFHRPLSEELSELIKKYEGRSVTLKEFEGDLEERGAAALMLLLTLPLTTPIPLPGASIIFGAVIIGLAFEIVNHKPPRLPKYIAQKKLEYATVKKILTASAAILRKLEKFLKPRFPIMSIGAMRYIAGISISSSAIALALPLPPVVPFTNGIPAFAIVFFALGFLEDDGVFIFLGHLIGLFAWAYIIFWWEVLWHGILLIIEKIS